MATICFYAQFIATKVGVNSLTVTWDIERITRSDGSRTALVTSGANGVTVGRRGLYGYVLSGADLTTYDYVATAITADTSVDQKEIAAVWTLWSLSWYDIATSIMTIVGSIGKLLVDNINATISSRSNLTAQQVWDALTTSLITPGSIGAWILDKLDVKVSSVSTGSVPTVAQIWQYAWRTLTTGSAKSGLVEDSSTISVKVYETLNYQLSDLGSLSNYATLYFTVKASKKDADSAALLQVSKKVGGSGDGLLVVLGAVATDASKGSITIDDAITGIITVKVNASIMALFQSGKYYADVKIVRSSGVVVEVLRDYFFNLLDTVTKAIT